MKYFLYVTITYTPIKEFHFKPLGQFEATFVSGGMAGTIAAAVTLPMDVIKTRRQVELGEKGRINYSYDYFYYLIVKC